MLRNLSQFLEGNLSGAVPSQPWENVSPHTYTPASRTWSYLIANLNNYYFIDFLDQVGTILFFCDTKYILFLIKDRELGIHWTPTWNRWWYVRLYSQTIFKATNPPSIVSIWSKIMQNVVDGIHDETLSLQINILKVYCSALIDDA